MVSFDSIDSEKKDKVVGNVLIKMVVHGIDAYQLTNIGKLAVLKDHKVVLLGQGGKLVNQILIEILNNVNVGLFRHSCATKKWSNMLAQQQLRILHQLLTLINSQGSVLSNKPSCN